MKEILNKRRWVKWVAVVFLTAMLLLTFFSNTIMNMSLPQVQIRRVVSGTITPTISGSGMTESAGVMQIISDTMGEVTEVYCAVGDSVEKGTELLFITPEDDGTLETMKDQLREMELQYALALLEADAGEPAEEELQRLHSELSEAEEKLEKAKEYESGSDELTKEKSSAEKALATANRTYAKEMKVARENLQSAEYAVQDAEAALSNATANLTYYEKLYAEVDPQNIDLAAARKTVTQAETALHDKQNLLYAVQNTYDALDRKYAPLVSDAQAVLDAVCEKETKLNETYAGIPDVKTAENDIQTIKDSITQYETSLKSEKINEKITALELEKQKKAIDKQAAAVEETEKQLEPQMIKATADGIITELPYTAGQIYNDGDLLLSAETRTDTYQLRFLVSVALAEKAIPGTEGYVDNTDGGDYHAVLRSVGPDPDGSANFKELVFDITGYSVAPGLELSVRLPLSENEYDMVIPTQAIYQDNAGTFVYAFESKSTPFGSRNKVRRVNIEVLDSDASYAAILAELSDRNYVVTLSNGPLQDGEQVRLGSGVLSDENDGAVG